MGIAKAFIEALPIKPDIAADAYGRELILDLWDCDVSKFNRRDIEKYFDGICKRIGMKSIETHFWDDQLDSAKYAATVPPHLYGTSACHFISTSSIILHALDKLGKLFVNVFACKDFPEAVAEAFTVDFFGGHVVEKKFLERK